MFNQHVSFQFLRAAIACSVVALSSLGLSRPASALGEVPLPRQVLVSALVEEESTDTALAGEARLAEALSIAERIERVDDKAIALAAIAQSYAEQSDLNRANELLSQALELAEKSAEPERSAKRIKVLNNIADGYIAAGAEEQAAEVLLKSLASVGEIRSRTPNYRYFLEAVERYGDFSDATLAQPGLEKAMQLANAIQERFRRSYALGKIAIAYSQLDNAAIADAGISTISNLLLTPDEDLVPRIQLINRDSELIDIAEVRARYGDSTAAIAHLGSVSGLDSFYNLSRIAAVYGLLNDTAMAKSALDELVVAIESLPEPENIHDINNRRRAINNTAIAYIEIGQPEVAHSFLAPTLPTLLESDGPEILPFLNQFANTYKLTGDIATQQALLQRAFEIFAPDNLADPNRISDWQVLVFENMAQSYAQLSEEAAPEQLELLLKIPTDNDWGYSHPMYLAMLSQAADQRGDKALMQQLHADALKLLTMDVNDVHSNMMLKTLIMLAEVYGQTSETSVAIEWLRSLTQVADSLASASGPAALRQQELLSAIAIAYASL